MKFKAGQKVLSRDKTTQNLNEHCCWAVVVVAKLAEQSLLTPEDQGSNPILKEHLLTVNY